MHEHFTLSVSIDSHLGHSVFDCKSVHVDSSETITRIYCLWDPRYENGFESTGRSVLVIFSKHINKLPETRVWIQLDFGVLCVQGIECKYFTIPCWEDIQKKRSLIEAKHQAAIGRLAIVPPLPPPLAAMKSC